MKIVPGVQGSSAWLQAHRGAVSGSYMKAVLDFTQERTLKSGEKRGGAPGSTRITYLKTKIAELLTARVESDNYVSKEMLEGTEREPLARGAYEDQEGVMVEEMGFALHDTIPRFGGSVDGLVGDDGFIEIKCPKPGTHQAWIRGRCVPEEHIPQIDSYFSITGRAWCDFISYCPYVPKEMQLMVIRRARDAEAIGKIEAAVMGFNAEVDAAIEELRQIVGPFELPASMQEEEKPDPDAQLGALTDEDFEWARQNL
jgi:hypothetical protein